MPFDASGNYSLPSGYLAENGQTIQPSQHNTPLEDIRSALSSSLLRTGVAPMSGALKVTDGTVALPGLSFNTSTGTGLYKTSNGFAASVSGSKVAEFGSIGLISGAIPVGLGPLPWSGSYAPSGWVLANGQTLSRTTYAALWAFAQSEITIGNVLYTNGDGTTTFTVPDLRCRLPFGRDNMGGAGTTSLLTSTYFGSAPNIIGNTGGTESKTLARANLPNATLTVSGSFSGGTTRGDALFGSGSGAPADAGPGQSGIPTALAVAGTITGTTSSINGGVTQTDVGVVNPGIIVSYIIFAGA